MDLLQKNLQCHIDAFEKLKNDEELQALLISTAEKLSESIKGGGKLIIFGNGGSAADSQHIAAEFVGRFVKERKAMPALALNCNSSVVTAVGNDYDFERIFARQIEAFGATGDVALGISTSGNSGDVLAGLNRAKEMGLFTVLLTGEGCRQTGFDVILKAPSTDTARIQEMHIFMGHFLAEYVEDKLFG